MTSKKGNLFVFEVGPSVKFVSAIKDAIFNKQIWGGGGSEGGLAKDQTFYGFFPRKPSLVCDESVSRHQGKVPTDF